MWCGFGLLALVIGLLLKEFGSDRVGISPFGTFLDLYLNIPAEFAVVGLGTFHLLARCLDLYPNIPAEFAVVGPSTFHFCALLGLLPQHSCGLCGGRALAL